MPCSRSSLGEPRHRARNAHRRVSVRRLWRCLGIVGCGCLRGRVDPGDRAVREPDQDLCAASNAVHRRLDHRNGKCRRDGRIGRVSPRVQHPRARFPPPAAAQPRPPHSATMPPARAAGGHLPSRNPNPGRSRTPRPTAPSTTSEMFRSVSSSPPPCEVSRHERGPGRYVAAAHAEPNSEFRLPGTDLAEQRRLQLRQVSLETRNPHAPRSLPDPPSHPSTENLNPHRPIIAPACTK